MVGRELDVDEDPSRRRVAVAELEQRDLRRVGPPAEHRLAGEHPADLDAIDAAHEDATLPHLDRPHPAEIGQLEVRVAHLRRYPCPLGPVRTTLDHGGRVPVDRRGPAAPMQRPAQAPAHVEAVGGQDGAWIRAEPEERHAQMGPGEHTPAVGGDERPRLQVGADTDDPVRIRAVRVELPATGGRRPWRDDAGWSRVLALPHDASVHGYEGTHRTYR